MALTWESLTAISWAEAAFPWNIGGGTPWAKAGLPWYAAEFPWVELPVASGLRPPPSHRHRPIHPGHQR